MPGSFVFRPIEANLTHNTDLITKMNPYCNFVLGKDNKIKTQVCKKGGKQPHWEDSVTIPADKIVDRSLIVEVMDKDTITRDDVIGVCKIPLQEVELGMTTSRWYPLFYKQTPAGEILVETTFQPEIIPGMEIEADRVVKTEQLIAEHDKELFHTKPVEVIAETEKMIIEEPVVAKVFTEQHQVVEPHTFVKDVEVVETVPVLKQIEVMEPRKVLKEVEYTEAVPVIKTIEVCEPEVVVKEIETVEPRVVTKTIQVVENVPVKKQVEVIEMRHVTKEVETLEPQTFVKQVEVIEQVPVMKTVEVSEPIHVTKAVEFVEPVITTQTIVKEVFEPVVVEEKVTTSVGPATLVTSKIEKEIVEEKIIEENFKREF